MDIYLLGMELCISLTFIVLRTFDSSYNTWKHFNTSHLLVMFDMIAMYIYCVLIISSSLKSF